MFDLTFKVFNFEKNSHLEQVGVLDNHSTLLLKKHRIYEINWFERYT